MSRPSEGGWENVRTESKSLLKETQIRHISSLLLQRGK